MADLKNLIPAETHTFSIVHPTTGEVLKNDKGKEMTITVHSPFSDVYRNVTHEQAKKRISQSASKGAKKEMTPQDWFDFSVDTMAEITAGWSIQFNKENLEFTPEKAKEIYKQIPWLLDLVREKQENLSSFFSK